MINPTLLAQTTRSSRSWADAKNRVTQQYRQWIRAAPEIQTMYSLNMPVSRIRTRVRQEFERHRYVAQVRTVDVLLAQSNMELQETRNYWKQLSHVLRYFSAEEGTNTTLPGDFMSGFLEGRN